MPLQTPQHGNGFFHFTAVRCHTVERKGAQSQNGRRADDPRPRTGSGNDRTSRPLVGNAMPVSRNAPSRRGLLRSKELIRVTRLANIPSRCCTATPVALRRAKESELSIEWCPWLLLSGTMFVAARHFGCCDPQLLNVSEGKPPPPVTCSCEYVLP